VPVSNLCKPLEQWFCDLLGQMNFNCVVLNRNVFYFNAMKGRKAMNYVRILRLRKNFVNFSFLIISITVE